MVNLKHIFTITAFFCAFGLLYIVFSGHSDPEVEKQKERFLNDYRIHPVALPSTMHFAGEPVPLNDQELYERIDREFMVNTYWQSNTLLCIKRSKRAFSIIEPILKKNGVPDDFKYLAVIESGLVPVISPAGASGVWQIMPATAKQYGLVVNNLIDERYNLEKSTEAACALLKDAKETFGTWTMAAAAYNMGSNGLKKQSEEQQTNDYYSVRLNPETSRYVPRMIAAKYIMENPLNYGFQIHERDYYPVDVFKMIEVDSSISNLTEFARNYQMTYKELRTLNPWMHGYSLPNKEGTPYQIKIVRK